MFAGAPTLSWESQCYQVREMILRPAEKSCSTLLQVTLHELFHGNIQKYFCLHPHVERGGISESLETRLQTTVLKTLWNAAVHTQCRLPDLTFPSPCTQRFHITLSLSLPLHLPYSSLSLSFSYSLSKESAGLAVCLVWPPSNTNTELCELKAVVLIVTQQCFIMLGPSPPFGFLLMTLLTGV